MYVLIIIVASVYATSVPDFNNEALCTAAKEKVVKEGNGWAKATCVQVR